MNFIEALACMIKGERVTIKNIGNAYLMILSGQNYIWKVEDSKRQSIDATIYVPAVDEILSKDWFEIKKTF